MNNTTHTPDYIAGYEAGWRARAERSQGIIGVSNLARIEHITEAVCEYFQISVEKIMRRTRERDVVYPRQFLIYFLRTKSTLTLVKLSKMFNLDHTTIIHSIRIIETLQKVDDRVAGDFNELNKVIGPVALPVEPKAVKVVKMVVKPEPEIVQIEPEPVPFTRPPAVYQNKQWQ